MRMCLVIRYFINIVYILVNECTVYLSCGIKENDQDVSNNLLEENIIRNIYKMNIPRFTN